MNILLATLLIVLIIALIVSICAVATMVILIWKDLIF